MPHSNHRAETSPDPALPAVASLAEYRSRRAERGGQRRAGRGPALPTLYFDLASPHTYFAAERAERMFAGLRWRAASSPRLGRHPVLAEERAPVARRAELLGMPLVWPDDPPVAVPRAMRVAALAAERGIGSQFALAATRLAFCGGFNIDDARVLCDAADAAGLDVDAALLAACDPRRDHAIASAGRRLLDAGADRLPVLELAGTLFCGEERLAEAAATIRHAS